MGSHFEVSLRSKGWRCTAGDLSLFKHSLPSGNWTSRCITGLNVRHFTERGES